MGAQHVTAWKKCIILFDCWKKWITFATLSWKQSFYLKKKLIPIEDSKRSPEKVIAFFIPFCLRTRYRDINKTKNEKKKAIFAFTTFLCNFASERCIGNLSKKDKNIWLWYINWIFWSLKDVVKIWSYVGETHLNSSV